MPHSITNYLAFISILSNEEIAAIAQHFTSVNIQKDEYILREGQVCKFVAFVETGLLMYYKVSGEGEEMVCDFAKEGDWASQYESFTSRIPSPLFIKAIEPCLIHTISLDQLNALYTQFPAFGALAKQIVEKAFMDMIKRSLDLQHLKAEERYRKFVADYADIVQRVPQYYIASFLGIAPQSLSRIRKNKA